MNRPAAVSPPPSIRCLTKNDITDALKLCRIAGWNQTRDDWLRLLDYEPAGCFVADHDQQLVGTVTTTCYRQALAWIGMMLVHPEWRRKSIATALMVESLGYLQDRNVQCIKLDATPAGQPLYEKLGFRVEWPFQRWQRDPQNNGPRIVTSPNDRAIPNTALHLDIEAFGCDRSAWLQRLSAVSTLRIHPRGFGMIRPGHLACYIGPVTAQDSEAAGEILQALLEPINGLVFWDVPQLNGHAVQLAKSLGFQPTRSLVRMWTGSKRLAPKMQLQYAISDPANG